MTFSLFSSLFSCLIAAMAALVWPDSDSGVWISAIGLSCALCSFLADVLIRRRAQEHLLAVVAAGGYLITFGVRGVIVGWNPALYWFPDRYSTASMSQALLLVCVGWFMFLTSYVAPWRLSTVGMLGKKAFRQDPAPWTIVIMCVVGVVGRIIQSVFYFAPVSWISSVGAVPGLAVAIGYVGIGLGIVAGGRGGRTTTLVALGTLSVYFVGSLVMGERVFLLRVGSYFFVYLLCARKVTAVFGSSRRIIWAGLAAVSFALVFVIISSYKSNSSAVGQEVGVRRYTAAMSLYQELLHGEQDMNEGEGFWNGISRRAGSGMDFLALLVDQTPQIWEFQRGRTVALIGTIFIPRMIWPEKPEVTMSGQFYEDYLGYRRINGSLGAAGYSGIGDLFLNWGMLGVAVGMCVVGLLARAYESFCLSGQDVGSVGLIVFATTATDLMQPSSTLADSIGAVAVRLFVVILALKFASATSLLGWQAGQTKATRVE